MLERIPDRSCDSASIASRIVDIHCVLLDAPSLDSDAAWSLLSPDEVMRARRFARCEDRRRWVAGRAALRSVLSGYTDIPAQQVRFTYGPYGKPHLVQRRDRRTVQFSVSHSRGLMVCAVARGAAIGVDVEAVGERWDVEELVRRRFARADLEPLLAAPVQERQRLFLRRWTRHEAYLKALGTGFGASQERSGLAMLATHDALMQRAGDREPLCVIRAISLPRGYVGALAVIAPDHAVRLEMPA